MTLFLGDWVDSGARLDGLLTSNVGFISAANAKAYGLDSTSSSFEKTSLNPMQRAGVLTRPGFLGSNAHADSSSPVKRGITVMDRLLCRTPPPVPAMVPPLPPADKTAVKTTRQRYDAHIKIGFCASCHAFFEPMGNAFEMFDAMGVYRTTENGAVVDTTGGIVGTTSVDGPVANAIELSQKLAASADVHACFTRQMLRYVSGRAENAFDEETLGQAAKILESSDLRVVDLIAALVASKSTSVRTVEIDP